MKKKTHRQKLNLREFLKKLSRKIQLMFSEQNLKCFRGKLSIIDFHTIKITFQTTKSQWNSFDCLNWNHNSLCKSNRRLDSKPTDKSHKWISFFLRSFNYKVQFQKNLCFNITFDGLFLEDCWKFVDKIPFCRQFKCSKLRWC